MHEILHLTGFDALGGGRRLLKLRGGFGSPMGGGYHLPHEAAASPAEHDPDLETRDAEPSVRPSTPEPSGRPSTPSPYMSSDARVTSEDYWAYAAGKEERRAARRARREAQLDHL